MNSKEWKRARVQLFRDGANLQKTGQIPHFASVVICKAWAEAYA